MKVRDSGMPDEAMWAQFFDARGILTALDFSTTNAEVVDFGCGYGTFTVAAARLTSGAVYALDIDAEMIAATAAKAASFGLDNERLSHGISSPKVLGCRMLRQTTRCSSHPARGTAGRAAS
jgi:ribosomal protein L11 methylase PrmA